MALNHGTKPIVTDGLVLCLDAADENSYPGSGGTVYDLTSNDYDFDITNATFNSSNGGVFSFDASMELCASRCESSLKTCFRIETELR